MTSPTKFYHVAQIILYMWSWNQSLVTAAFISEKLSEPQFYKDLTRKTTFLRGGLLGLALGMPFKFYTSVAKRFKLKVRKFWELILTFAEVTGENLVGVPLCIQRNR